MKQPFNNIDEDTFSQLANHIEAELEKNHLSTALNLLSQLLDMVAELPDYNKARESTETAAADYHRLLHYMAEGTKDPQRHAVQSNLVQKTFRIMQDLRRSFHIATQKNIYSSTAALTSEHEQQSLHTILQAAQLASDPALQDILFDCIWTAPQLTAAEENELRLALYAAPLNMQAYVMSALTMALLHYFDPTKFRLLLSYASAQEKEVSARAMVGTCIVTQIHATRLTLFPQLADEVTQLLQAPQRMEDMTLIQHFICLYLETERIQQKFEKEIIPTLIKLGQQRKKLGFDDMELDLTDPESTPEISRKTRHMLNDSMQEMAQLFHEGMDLNLHTFTSLKSFPFFHRVGHWLAPYDASRSDIADHALIRLLPICDSDKYSIAALFKHIAEEQREAMKKNIDKHAEIFATHQHETGNEFQNVIQCLYRLLKRSPWTSLWPQVFSPDMLFINNPILHRMVEATPKFLLETGTMLLRHKFYDAAEKHLNLYAQSAGADVALLLKLGLCAQQQGKYSTAIRRYQQAGLLDPNNTNVTYRLQYCYAQTGRYQEQLDSLLSLEKATPDDARVLMETGLCCIQLKKWEEAERRFYKLEFKGKHVIPSVRSIAWCCLNRGDYEAAKKNYLRIFNEAPTEANWEDYLNMGHTTWLLGDTPAALAFYAEYAHRYLIAQPEAKDALMPFTEDAALLRSKGKLQNDIDLMYDLITEQLS